MLNRHRDQSFSPEPYWIVTRHPFMRSDGTRVPTRTRALYCPATHQLLFGAEAAAAGSVFPLPVRPGSTSRVQS